MTQELRKLAEELLFTGRLGTETEEQAAKRRIARNKAASLAMLELLDRVEKAEKDAERYRWLRNDARSVDWSRNYEGTSSYSLFCRNNAEQMDKQIDAAMETSK